MFKRFKKKEEKIFTDEELFFALKNDPISLSEELFQKAKNDDGKTLCSIGTAYCDLYDFSKALAWFRKGDAQNNSDSQNMIGLMYCFGNGVSRDYQQAMKWFLKAFNNDGNSLAQYNIGEMYNYGNGVEKDYKQAMNWYLKAVNNDGNSLAQYTIGMLYADGHGVPKNIHTAIEWFTKAAKQNHELAQYNLACIYERVREIKNLQKAVNWYKRAADNGYENAKKALKKLTKQGYYPNYDPDIFTSEGYWQHQ